MSGPTRVFLVDSSIYVFRAWFTLPDSIVERDGSGANAVYGFTDFVYRLLEEARPAQIAFAFDESLTSSFRNEIYPDYKANREPAPKDLKRQFRRCREFIRTIGITELGSDHYEADDLIGSVLTRARRDGRPATVVTADKDLTQLIGADDQWWDFAGNRRLDSAQITAKFGVRPDQIADQLALAGDAVDNIPGVPGIGMATAAKLLKRFETIDNLLANIERIHTMKVRGAARLQTLLETHQDTVRLSAQLTPIHCDAELPADLNLERGPVDARRLTRLFDELGFAELRRRRWREMLQPS